MERGEGKHCQWQHLNKIDFPFWPIKLFTQNDNCPHLSSSLPLDFVCRRIRCLCVYVRVCVCVFVLHSSTWGINKNLLINVQFNFVLLLISGLGSASLAGSSSSPLPSSPASSSSLQRLPSAIYATYSHMDFISFMRSFFSFFLSCLLAALFFCCLCPCLDSVSVARDAGLGVISHTLAASSSSPFFSGSSAIMIWLKMGIFVPANVDSQLKSMACTIGPVPNAKAKD